MTISIHLNSAEDTHKFGALIGSCIRKRAFIGLCGELGAGKTTLTQGLAGVLGVSEPVSSPTFLMLNEYHSGRLPLYHFDLYRLQEDLDTDSAAATILRAELAEICQSDREAVIVVEWIDLWEDFASDYDELRIELKYDHVNDGRQICLNPRGRFACELLKNMETAGAAGKFFEWTDRDFC